MAQPVCRIVKREILVTSNNDKWINISRPANQACLTVVTNSSSLDEATSYEFKNFIDTDGNDFSPNNYTCMAEDKNGYIWIGTNKGAIYLTNPKLATTENNQSIRCTRIKLINEEGTPYYFLDNTIITTIKVDNGNRKWIGTDGNGVYVLSEDNQEIVHQFNTSNSPLLSDKIYSIEIMKTLAKCSSVPTKAWFPTKEKRQKVKMTIQMCMHIRIPYDLNTGTK
jgi:ligand-binding sensor domain-containing protein